MTSHFRETDFVLGNESMSFFPAGKVDPKRAGRAVSAPWAPSLRRCRLCLWIRWWLRTRPFSLTSSHRSARSTRVRLRAARAGPCLCLSMRQSWPIKKIYLHLILVRELLNIDIKRRFVFLPLLKEGPIHSGNLEG